MSDLFKRYAVLLECIKDLRLRVLVESLLNSGEVYRRPASRRHHTGEWGMLEHCVEVAEVGMKIVGIFSSPVSMDFIIVGGLLHDYGKTLIAGTPEDGCLQHCMLGANAVYKAMEDMGTFSTREKLVVSNMVRCHHKGIDEVASANGLYLTLEDHIVHIADELSATQSVAKTKYAEGVKSYDMYWNKGMLFTIGGRL